MTHTDEKQVKRDEVSLEGLDKADVLAALYNASKQQGMGFIHAQGAKLMTTEEARELLKTRTRFDYLHGRVMKVDLTNDVLWPGLYDRDLGVGAAQSVIDRLRSRP